MDKTPEQVAVRQAGGLTAEEWKHVAAVMWQWPSMGFCAAADVQPLITAANARAAQAQENTNAPRS